MKSFLRYAVVIVCALLLASRSSRAQELSEQLKQLGQKNASLYVSPLLYGWAAGFNSAFYHSADLHDILGFDVQLKVFGAKIDAGEKEYTFEMPDQFKITRGATTFTLTQGIDYDKLWPKSPTVAGEDKSKGVKIKPGSAYYGILDTIFVIPKGFNFDYAPLFAPQVSVGLPFGLEVTARYLPPFKIPGAKDLGKVSIMGFGVRHDIDQYLPFFPVDIAIHFMTQSFKVSDASDNELISGSGMAYGIEVSKKLLFITLYGGFQLENGSFTAKYTYTDPLTSTKIPIEVKADDKNSSRATVGLRLLLLLINVHAEASFGNTPVYALGAGITLR